MKKITEYNALGDKNFNKFKFQTITRHLIFLIYTPICHIIRLLGCMVTKQRDKCYNVSIATIFKNEAEYLDEWVCYHKLIGVEHMYLYNNFSDDNYLEILTPYVESGFITLIDWEVPHGQLAAYKHCIERYSEESNWIAFIDIDEFICLKKHRLINDWLKSYRRYPSVLINWKMFGTSGLLERDKNRLIIEQFDSSWAEHLDVGKSIINTSYKFKRVNHCHRFKAKVLGVDIPPVDEFKQFVINWIYMPNFMRRESQIQINHYWSKAYSDYIYKDTIRGSAMSAEASERRRDNLNRRFDYHETNNTVKDHTIQRFLTLLKSSM